MADNFIQNPIIGALDGESDCNWIKVNFGNHVVLMTRETLEFYDPKFLTLECKETGIESSHKVQDIETTTIHHRPTFQDLPDEMMSKVFMFLENGDLLRRCRLVSKRWKTISSEICRQRFVRLKCSSELDKGRLNNIFTDMKNLPWSSSHFFQPKCDIPKITEGRFLKFFGKHMWRLTLTVVDRVEVSDADYERILCQTPNLRRLEIFHANQDWISSGRLQSVETGLDLRKLKWLKLSILNDCNVEFIKYIIEHGGARLDYFKSSIKLLKPENVGAIAQLLRHVPFISLKVQHNTSDDFKHFVSETKNLCIKELYLSLPAFDEKGQVNYEPAERFMAHHSGHLEKLNIVVRASSSIPFNFPFLPSLTFLGITFDNLRDESLNAFGFLSLLQTNQFPILDQFEVIGWCSSRDNNTTSTRHLYFPENCHFDSVSKFTMWWPRRIRDNWSRVFPNLKFLAFKYARDHEALVDIFSHTTLEHLILTFDSPASEVRDINSFLTGIPNPDENDKSEEEIRRERAIHGRPSILQLTNLRTLEIGFPGRFLAEQIRDSGTCMSLLYLQPLNLTLSNVELSDECRGKLRAHHRNFSARLKTSIMENI